MGGVDEKCQGGKESKSEFKLEVRHLGILSDGASFIWVPASFTAPWREQLCPQSCGEDAVGKSVCCPSLGEVDTLLSGLVKWLASSNQMCAKMTIVTWATSLKSSLFYHSASPGSEPGEPGKGVLLIYGWQRAWAELNLCRSHWGHSIPCYWLLNCPFTDAAYSRV